jgi:hypothetical protein
MCHVTTNIFPRLKELHDPQSYTGMAKVSIV